MTFFAVRPVTFQEMYEIIILYDSLGLNGQRMTLTSCSYKSS